MNEEVTEKPQILFVDDSKVIRRAAVKMLGKDYQIHEAVDGMDGWQQLQRNDAISVVFADMQMPEMGGMELLANIRNSDDDRLAALPVIIITGVGDTEEAKRAVFDAGATDFIAKPFESIDLLSRAKSYARLNRKVVELEKKTGYDKLTGLFSVAIFEEQGEKALSFALRHRLQISAVYLEIVNFQDIYLTHGKGVAQQIITTVGKRLKDVMRTEDIAARIGVAKYAALLPLTSEPNATIVIKRIRESVNKLVFNTGREKIRISLAAGYTSADVTEKQEFSEIMEQADTALQKALASSSGEKVCSFFDKEAVVETGKHFTDEDIHNAFQHVLDGAYFQVPDHMLQAVADKLTPFLDYVANRTDTGRTGTDNS
ncbi:MAG: diguanylate cyclase [Thiotrichales bacterium]|nr:MAG: diguanylate cyclase [Thiotrichales bacterium]